MVNRWKVTSIIFIVLFILETCFIIWAINYGTQMVDNENKCMINVCGPDIYDSYFYDDYDKMCYCYTNHEVTKQEYLE